MEYVNLRGEKVPKIGLGTWKMTDRCVESVKTALNHGYRHIDTAQVYGNEEKVGRGIEESNVDREEIWVTTKVWRDNLNQRDLKKSVDESLEKLRTDYVDLLLIHWPFREMDMETVLSEMNDLVEEGKVRKIGISNFNTDQMERAQELSEAELFTNQVEYHPFLGQDEVLEKCREMDMMLTAYSPLARGEVLGNMVLDRIGQKYGKSEAQVALRWLTQQDNVCAIPKASTERHIKENFNIFDFELNPAEMEEVSDLYRGKRKVDPSFGPDWD